MFVEHLRVSDRNTELVVHDGAICNLVFMCKCSDFCHEI